MTNPEDIKLRAREVLVNRLRGHALGLAARGRYDPAQSAQITNAEAASYGNLLDEAASMLASLSPERDGEMRERIARALYKHWVEEDFATEYAAWGELAGKDVWYSRADAILSLLSHKGKGS